MRLLSRFGLAALAGFSVSSLIALASYSLGLWLGRNSYNLRWIIYASIPFGLLVGVAAVLQPKRNQERRGTPIIAVLVGAVLGLIYTFLVAIYGLAVLPAFIVVMASSWVPGGISAMLVADRTKRLSVLIGVTVICVVAVVFPEPAFNLLTHNQQLTVALITSCDTSTAQLEARPETVGFDSNDEVQAAKTEVLEHVRNLGHTETIRVLSIIRAGKGRKSLAIIIVRAPITKDVALPVPDGSTVLYTQGPSTWEKNPANSAVLRRAIMMGPRRSTNSSVDVRAAYFDVPDSEGATLIGRIVFEPVANGYY